MADSKIYRDDRGRVSLVDRGVGGGMAEIDQTELMARILEAISDTPRPEGMPAEKLLDGILVNGKPGTMATLDRISMAVIEYFAEVMAKAVRMQ